MNPLIDTERKELSALDKKAKSGKAAYREMVRAIRLALRRNAHAG